MLDAFHPGRIDLGVGRSGQRRREEAKRPPSDRPKPPREWREIDGVVVPPPFDMSALMRNPRLQARMAVLQQPEAVSPDFGEQVGDILAMLAGTYAADGVESHVVPGERATLSPWVFGSSKGQSAQVAGARGLPFVASYHITPATALEAVEVYREAFRPSETLREPYVVVSADIVVADDTDTARQLASSYGQWVYSIRAGDGAVPYPDPDTAAPLSAEQLRARRGPHRDAVRRRSRRGCAPPGGPATAHRCRRAGRHVGHAPARRPAALARADREAVGLDVTGAGTRDEGSRN